MTTTGQSTAADSSATYRKILDDMGTQLNSWQRDDFFKEQILPMFNELDPEELAAHKEDLLMTAAACNAYDVTEMLLKRFPDWSFDSLKSAADISAGKGHVRTLRELTSAGREHPQYLALLLFLNANRDNYPSETVQTLTGLKHNYLGSEWKILNTNEISRTAHSATASIERVFNFQAMNITTIATVSGKAPAVSVTDRNFNDCQNDDAIAEAHEKLALFEKDAPAYRGKNTQPRRRIQKRDRG